MKYDMNIRIKARRLQLALTQQALAKKLAVSRVSITKWETGITKPDGENLQRLSKTLDVSPEWLLYGGDTLVADNLLINRKSINIRKIPLISPCQAVEWLDVYSSVKLDDIQSWYHAALSVSDEAYALIVKGESMINPSGYPSIPEGAIIIVEPHYERIDELYGKIVVAKVKGTSDIIIKKLVWDAPYCYLMPLNPLFNPITIDNDYQIIGSVIQVIQIL